MAQIDYELVGKWAPTCSSLSSIRISQRNRYDKTIHHFSNSCCPSIRSLRCQLCFGAYMGNQATLINIGPGRVINPRPAATVVIKRHSIHNYRLEVTPGSGSELSIDVVPITSIHSPITISRIACTSATIPWTATVVLRSRNMSLRKKETDIHMQSAASKREHGAIHI